MMDNDVRPRECDKKRWRTQRDKVRDWLLDGHTLTQDEARERFGIMRLASRIFELRAKNLDIRVNMVPCGEARVAEYYLVR